MRSSRGVWLSRRLQADHGVSARGNSAPPPGGAPPAWLLGERRQVRTPRSHPQLRKPRRDERYELGPPIGRIEIAGFRERDGGSGVYEAEAVRSQQPYGPTRVERR